MARYAKSLHAPLPPATIEALRLRLAEDADTPKLPTIEVNKDD